MKQQLKLAKRTMMGGPRLPVALIKSKEPTPDSCSWKGWRGRGEGERERKEDPERLGLSVCPGAIESDEEILRVFCFWNM